MGHTPRTKPAPQICERPYNQDIYDAAVMAGWQAPAARVIASRLGDTLDALALIEPGTSQLDHPNGLPDIDIAARRIVDAIHGHETIAIVTDYDVDGLDSHALILHALMRFGATRERLLSYVGHRLNEGYGLSQRLTERILANDTRPDVLITADHGSKDEPRITALRAQGIDVIVTDHHELAVEDHRRVPPKSAYACVSPLRSDSRYPDRTIAGAMVAWLLMCKVRLVLVECGDLRPDEQRLADLLDYVALATIADCVDLGHSVNNRVVVQAGLRMIAQQRRPCWAMAFANGWLKYPLSAQSCAFGAAPRINSFSRLDDAMAGLHWLMAESVGEAEQFGQIMDEANRERKGIEQRMTDEAFAVARGQVEQQRWSIVVWFADGHPGVQGIVASRITEAFGRPSVCLSPKVGDTGLASGSARGVDGVHIEQALQRCADANPQVFEAFGGHRAAGGLTIRAASIEVFSQAFEDAVQLQARGKREMGPIIHTDGAIDLETLSLDLARDLAQMEPFGKGFEPPLFEATLRVLGIRAVGDGSHWRLRLTDGTKRLEAIWFSATQPGATRPPIQSGATARFCFSVGISTFRGQTRLDIHIRHGSRGGDAG